MSDEKESDDPNASEEEEDGKEQGEDEILHLKTKLREMAEEADSKMLRVACRLSPDSKITRFRSALPDFRDAVREYIREPPPQKKEHVMEKNDKLHKQHM